MDLILETERLILRPLELSDAEAMFAMDKLNARFGREKIRIGKQGFGRKWHLKQEKVSKCYTTQFDDIILIN